LNDLGSPSFNIFLGIASGQQAVTEGEVLGRYASAAYDALSALTDSLKRMESLRPAFRYTGPVLKRVFYAMVH